MNRQEIESRRQKVVEMRNGGMTFREIGEHLGISTNAANCIYNRPMKNAFTLKEPKHQPAPDITTEEVLKIAEKVKQETGRYPSYGKVVQGIENGRIDPWRYIRRKRRVI